MTENETLTGVLYKLADSLLAHPVGVFILSLMTGLFLLGKIVPDDVANEELIRRELMKPVSQYEDKTIERYEREIDRLKSDLHDRDLLMRIIETEQRIERKLHELETKKGISNE